jgi:hypothetical protein
LVEVVEPVSRWILYFKPRGDDQWVLFFNEMITFASHREAFEDTFERTTGPDDSEVPLKPPHMLIYMKASMTGDLLGQGVGCGRRFTAITATPSLENCTGQLRAPYYGARFD